MKKLKRLGYLFILAGMVIFLRVPSGMATLIEATGSLGSCSENMIFGCFDTSIETIDTVKVYFDIDTGSEGLTPESTIKYNTFEAGVSVPKPGTMFILGLGLSGLAALGRSRVNGQIAGI